ncbi:MAG: HEPN domain-containing protein [Candidatus Aenigmarchaeota archaeon]|nr:HEPN domain-containing protein [Candidatus Aenigmarchaeota archaeon]
MVKGLKLSYNGCIKEKLLRKILPSKEKAIKSLKKSEKLLEDAKKNFNIELWDGTVIMAYLSIFHAARAILIRDGWREKAHACIARYLEEHYVKKNKLDRIIVDLLDRFRYLRHEDQYDVDFFATKTDAEEMLEFARKIIPIIKKIIETT